MSHQPPSHAELASTLAVAYGIRAATLRSVPLGHSACTHFVQAETAEQSFLCKLQEQEPPLAGLAIAAALERRGLPVLGPILTRVEAPATTVAGWSLTLYPALAAATLDPDLADPSPWQALGTLLRAVHTSDLPARLLALLPVETFRPSGEALIAELSASAQLHVPGNPHRTAAVRLWNTHAAALRTYFDRAAQLGQEAAALRPPLHLVHNDPHPDNILLDRTTGHVTLIDWEWPMLGPAERDLMHIPTAHRAAFGLTYGPHLTPSVVLRFVLADRLLQDLLDCFHRLLHLPLAEPEAAWALSCLASSLPRLQRPFPGEQTPSSG